MTVIIPSPLKEAAKDLKDMTARIDETKKSKEKAAEAAVAKPCWRCKVLGNAKVKLGKGKAKLEHNQTVIGKSIATIIPCDGLDVAELMESQIFRDLKDSLAKRAGCEVSKIQVQSVVGKLRSATYKTIHKALPVNETEKRSSQQIAVLDAGTMVNVLEIHDDDDEGRVRARIESPDGWISLSHAKGVKYAEQIEASHDITYADFLVDAKVDRKELSGIHFVRGSAVAVLIVIHVEGAAGTDQQNYTVLVEQDKVPFDLAAIAEIPSGAIDTEGNFTGSVAKDLSEKLGIMIKTSDLVDVTDATYKDAACGAFPCCGADNFNRVFVLQERTTAEDYEKLKASLSDQKVGGMKLRLVALDGTLDNSMLPAVTLYEKLNAAGLIRQIDSKEWHFGNAVGSAIGRFVRWMR